MDLDSFEGLLSPFYVSDFFAEMFKNMVCPKQRSLLTKFYHIFLWSHHWFFPHLHATYGKICKFWTILMKYFPLSLIPIGGVIGTLRKLIRKSPNDVKQILVENLSKCKISPQEHLKHLIDISTSRRAVRNTKIH